MKEAHDLPTVIISIVLLVSLGGLIRSLFRVLIRQRREWKFACEKDIGVSDIVAKMAMTIIGITYVLFIAFFLICLTWFPNFLSPFWKLACLIISVPCLACILGVYYGLGPAIASGNLPSSQIFGEISNLKSGKNDTKEKIGSHDK